MNYLHDIAHNMISPDHNTRLEYFQWMPHSCEGDPHWHHGSMPGECKCSHHQTSRNKVSLGSSLTWTRSFWHIDTDRLACQTLLDIFLFKSLVIVFVKGIRNWGIRFKWVSNANTKTPYLKMTSLMENDPYLNPWPSPGTFWFLYFL